MTAHHLPEVIAHEDVAEAVRRAVGKAPVALVQHPTKLPRVVFEAQLPPRRRREPGLSPLEGRGSEGEVVFFKAELPNDEQDYAIALEAWAMTQAAAQGLPVAEVLHVDCSEREFPFRFMVMTRVAGSAVRGSRLEWGQEVEVLLEAGRRLHALHRIELTGFGRLDEDLYLKSGAIQGVAAEWRDMAAGEGLEALDRLEGVGVLSSSEGHEARRRLSEGSILVPDLERGRLLHGDFDRSHIFVSAGGSMTGVIDFGDRESGDPEWEMSGMWLWDGEEYLAPVLEGYRGAGGVLDDALIRHYGLIRLLRLIRRRHDSGRSADVRALKPRMTAILRG